MPETAGADTGVWMRRATAALTVSLAAVAVALPAAAANLRVARGSLVAVSATSVSVKTAKGTVSCKLGSKSPSQGGFVTGERVQIACRRGGGHWLLTVLRHVGVQTAAANDDAPATQFGGAITDLSDTSISLHDGNRDLTCAIDSTSPSVATLKVGMHVGVACAGGTLVSWAPVTSGRAYQGKIASIGDAGVIVLYAGGTAACTIGPSSPSLDGFAKGDYVLMGCSIPAGQLVLLKHLDVDSSGSTGATGATGTTGATTGTSVDQTTKGTVTAVGNGSITVHNTERGDLTCTVGDGSPSVAGFQIGDLAGMGCKAGVLVIIVKQGSGSGSSTSGDSSPPPLPPPTTTTTSSQPSVDQTTKGTITALSDGAVTVHNNEHGDLTCSISDGSPSLDGLQIGDLAGMGCKAGVLVVIVKHT
jgi:hypothetical protein